MSTLRSAALTALDNLSLYRRYIGIAVRSQLQYRASFVMTLFGNLVATGIEFLGIWALFDRFGSLRGWKLPEVALFYGVANVAFAIAEALARGFDTFPNMVKSGDFDRLLLRPRSTALQVTAGELQLMRVGRLAQGLVVLGWSMRALSIGWTAATSLVIASAIFAGFCVFAGLFVLQATMSFWTIETLEIMNTVTYGGTETAQYPLTIYKPWFRRFFTFVIPLACANYLPLSPILGRTSSAGGVGMAVVSPLVGMLFLGVSFSLWKIGVRHYHSTGS
jgi:ABC-2 type transport system permease protein